MRRVRLRWWLSGGVALAAGGVLLLIVGSTWALLAVGGAAMLAGALIIAAILTFGGVRRELRRHAEIVERGTIEVLPPARVLDLLLARVYGPSPGNRDAVTSMLGGAGRAVDGSDLTISEHTEVHYRLNRVDQANYQLVVDEKYSFRNRVPATSFVIFATSDPVLRDSVIWACRLPLFTMWFVQDDPAESMFEESVQGMRDSVMVGMQYVDDQGVERDVGPHHPASQLREIKIQEWGRYLSFFRTDVPEQEAADRQQYMYKLRIFELDLHSLAEASTAVATVRRLTVRSTTLQLFENRFCYWEAPYPCFVDRMQFDVVDLGLDSEPELRFRLKPFSFRSRTSPTGWSTAAEIKELPVQSWMLPGHGVALMWRAQE